MSTNRTEITLQNDALRQYEQLMASIGGIFWEADASTFQFTYVSEQAERLLGYPLAQWFTPDFWANHLHPADRDWAVERCRRAVCNCKHSVEYRMIAADGRLVWLRDMSSVAVEGDPATTLRGIMIDITERKQAEEERQAQLWFRESMDKANRTNRNLQESELRYREVFENTSDVIAIAEVTEDGRFKWLDFNPAWEKMVGLRRTAFIGTFLEDLSADESAHQALDAIPRLS